MRAVACISASMEENERMPIVGIKRFENKPLNP
jgi:hypothetical protein